MRDGMYMMAVPSLNPQPRNGQKTAQPKASQMHLNRYLPMSLMTRIFRGTNY